jgi:uncharacterized membrane protein
MHLASKNKYFYDNMQMKRINSIDITRGLVMVIMALDHVRDFMHSTSMSQSPTNLQTTTTLLFMTRWVTHLCAPTFVFLSGVSAYISFKRKNNLSESRAFLLKRGIWLVILEFTFINFALWYDIHFRLMIMEVISAIGLSFIVLSFLLKLSSRTIGIIGLIIIFCHNLLQGINIPSNPVAIFFSSVLFRPFMMNITPDLSFFTAYPLVPWLGIMLSGFACGEFFEISSEKRNKVFLRIGLATLSLFTIIRFINLYGDPSVWSKQKSVLFTFLSFINTTKYPPSLLFILLFLGIMFLILFISEKLNNRFTGILEVYGRVPLFYFVIHLFIIHSLMFVLLFLQGFGTKDLLFGVFNNGRPKTGGGVDLPAIYVIWLCIVVLLYPLCKWYGRYKSEHRENQLLRYL